MKEWVVSHGTNAQFADVDKVGEASLLCAKANDVGRGETQWLLLATCQLRVLLDHNVKDVVQQLHM